MSAPALTKQSKTKPSLSDDDIIELVPPPEWGFSGTALLRTVTDAALIAELLRRGYTRVERKEPGA